MSGSIKGQQRSATCCTAGVAIPGDPAAIEAVGVETDAQALFVIEKEASFQVCRVQCVPIACPKALLAT